MIYDIIIVGAGTAGLSAALYAARSGKRVLVFEEKNAGGQIIDSPEVDNYPGIGRISGFQFIQGLEKQVKDAGAELQLAKVTCVKEADGIKEVSAGDAVFRAGTVILAMGLKKRRLGLKREEELIGRGVSYCAVCDGAFYRDRDVAVVGGGNTALEDAVFLSGYCRMVYLVHRRDCFRGETSIVNQLKEKANVRFVMESEVTSLQGTDKLTSVFCKNRAGEISELQVSGVFVAVGQIPQNEIVSGLVTLSEDGYIQADETCITSAPGIFAAGDCRTKQVRQLVTAAADGAVAALEACKYAG